MKLGSAITASGSRLRSGFPAFALAMVLFVGLTVTTPGFFTDVNLVNMLRQQVTLACVTIGQALVIMAGGLDLSIGSVLSLTTAILSLDVPAPISAVSAVLAALAVGTVNATGIVYFRVHPILMTLGSLTVVQGVTLVVRPVPGGSVPGYLTAFDQANFSGIPLAVIALVIVVIISASVLNRTRFGLHLLAAGGSLQNAELSGIRASRVIAVCYILSSLLACLGGFNLAARISSGDPLVGQPFALDAVAATALGGTLLSGGIGSISGPLAGLAILAFLSNGLNLWNTSAYYQMLIKGLLLVLAVAAHRRSVPGL